MKQALAYHAVVHALEAKAGHTPVRKFAAAIGHALAGHLPHQRYLAAGRRLQMSGTGSDVLERMVREQLALDLNPLSQAPFLAADLDRLVSGYNEYNTKAQLGARTAFQAAQNNQKSETAVIARRETEVPGEPKPCRHAAVYAFEYLATEARKKWVTGKAASLRRMSHVATALGLESSALGEICRVIEALGHAPIPQVARELGVSQRTLERRLSEDGLTAERLRQVDRVLRALDGIRAGLTLAEVAAQSGFSDQPQMTRVFRASCELTPAFFCKFLSPQVRTA